MTPFHARSWLYHVAPLHGEATVVLDGTSVNSNQTNRLAEYPLTQPVAWTRQYKQSRVFFTTLGHPDDFAQASMRRLVINGIYWALGRTCPPGARSDDRRHLRAAADLRPLQESSAGRPRRTRGLVAPRALAASQRARARAKRARCPRAVRREPRRAQRGAPGVGVLR